MNVDEVSTAAEPETEQASRWEDYIDVFFSPAELFRRRADDRVAPPLITLIVLALVFYVVMLPANAMVMRASVAQGTNPDAAEAMATMGTIFQVIGAIMVPIMYFIVIASTAALLWLIGRFADIRIDFGRAMLIATYGGFIYLLAQIAGGVAVLIKGEAGLVVARDLSFGPARFLATADTPGALLGVLRRFEVFAMWQAVVWAIGIREIYRTTTARAAVVAFMTWLLFVIPGILGGLLPFGGGR